MGSFFDSIQGPRRRTATDSGGVTSSPFGAPAGGTPTIPATSLATPPGQLAPSITGVPTSTAPTVDHVPMSTDLGTTPFDFSRIKSNTGETAAQTAARYTQDYHAPDAPDVLANLPAWQAQQAQSTHGGGPDFPTPFGSISAEDSAAVDALLAKYHSTDSADYWKGIVAQHGGSIAAVGPEWLEDRIMRGDGSEGVRNGTVQKFQDTNDTNNTDALSALAAGGGHSPFGGDIEGVLRDIIAKGGVTPNITGDLINARENEANAEMGQLADARAQLAQAGGSSEPGVAQGPNISAIERIQTGAAPAYAQAVRDIGTHAEDTQNANLMSALQMATGMSQDDAHNIISAVGTGTQGRVALAGIALDQLKESDDWNKFLANNGIDQAKLQNDINQGHWDNIIRLLQIYTQGGGIAAGGHV